MSDGPAPVPGAESHRGSQRSNAERFDALEAAVSELRRELAELRAVQASTPTADSVELASLGFDDLIARHSDYELSKTDSSNSRLERYRTVMEALRLNDQLVQYDEVVKAEAALFALVIEDVDCKRSEGLFVGLPDDAAKISASNMATIVVHDVDPSLDVSDSPQWFTAAINTGLKDESIPTTEGV